MLSGDYMEYLSKYSGYTSKIPNESQQDDSDVRALIQTLNDLNAQLAALQGSLSGLGTTIADKQSIVSTLTNLLTNRMNELERLKRDVQNATDGESFLNKFDDIIISFYSYGIFSVDFSLGT